MRVQAPNAGVGTSSGRKPDKARFCAVKQFLKVKL
jgi:hypothetical protein